MKEHRFLPAGFTLLEVAVVLLIGGLLMMSGATMLIDYLSESRMILTQNRMQDIDNALIQYLNVNGVLPCPASLIDTPDTQTFGRSITDNLPNSPGCFAASATSATPGATYATTGYKPVTPTTNKTGHIVMGAVPIRSLNLPDQEMTDAWGDRFVYTVTDALTVLYDPTQGSIGVEDSNDNLMVGPTYTPPDYAQYVIVSYGADRAGAYSINGAKSSVACPIHHRALEKTNCTYPSSLYRKTLLLGFQTGNGYFDDYVTYRTQTNSTGTVPSGLIAPFGLAGCPPGWQGPLNLSTACTPPANGVCCQKQ